jgi:nicotinate phosphoribosyltransferase
MDALSSPLLTDLYQLTMLQVYFEHGMEGEAVFEFFVRELPPGRSFLVAAGLEPALAFLEGLRFTEEDLAWVRSSGRFADWFPDRLGRLRFTGAVDALPEGTVFFAGEPVLRVTAPLPEAQLVETRLINLLQYSTLVASKAARCALAAPGRLLVDFGLRRAHGAEAGLLAARASYIGGFDGTSNVLAAQSYRIPAYGTMAHSFIQAHDDEAEAFARFARAFPGQTTLLIDTYDTEEGARRVVELVRSLAGAGVGVQAVRLDSGDICLHACRVRAILDAGGLRGTRIFSSGSLDEQRLQELVRCPAPIDGFGVGTLLVTSADAPYLECAYKLQEYDGVPRRKRSEGKATLPGRKQVWRRTAPDGIIAADVVGLDGEAHDGEPLLRPAMRAGRRTSSPEPIESARARAAAALASLPAPLRELGAAAPYRVTTAASLAALAEAADRRREEARRRDP